MGRGSGSESEVDDDASVASDLSTDDEGEGEATRATLQRATPETWRSVALMYFKMEASVTGESVDGVDAKSFEGVTLHSALKESLITVLLAVQLIHKHNASAGGKRGETARAELKRELIRVTDDDVEGVREAWQKVCNVEGDSEERARPPGPPFFVRLREKVVVRVEEFKVGREEGAQRGKVVLMV